MVAVVVVVGGVETGVSSRIHVIPTPRQERAGSLVEMIPHPPSLSLLVPTLQVREGGWLLD